MALYLLITALSHSHTALAVPEMTLSALWQKPQGRRDSITSTFLYHGICWTVAHQVRRKESSEFYPAINVGLPVSLAFVLFCFVTQPDSAVSLPGLCKMLCLPALKVLKQVDTWLNIKYVERINEVALIESKLFCSLSISNKHVRCLVKHTNTHTLHRDVCKNEMLFPKSPEKTGCKIVVIWEENQASVQKLYAPQRLRQSAGQELRWQHPFLLLRCAPSKLLNELEEMDVLNPANITSALPIRAETTQACF